MITLKNKQIINTYETVLILKPEQVEEDTVQNQYNDYA
nr:ribosomal protein S6 [Porphyropsis coccinea]